MAAPRPDLDYAAGSGRNHRWGDLHQCQPQGTVPHAVERPNSRGLPDISAGVATFDGAGNIARTDGLPGYCHRREQRRNGQPDSIASGTYNVDPTCGIPLINSACGRVTVTLTGVTNPPVWYLVSTDQAFVVGTDPSVTAGSFVQQTVPGSGFSIASIWALIWVGRAIPSPRV